MQGVSKMTAQASRMISPQQNKRKRSYQYASTNSPQVLPTSTPRFLSVGKLRNSVPIGNKRHFISAFSMTVKPFATVLGGLVRRDSARSDLSMRESIHARTFWASLVNWIDKKNGTSTVMKFEMCVVNWLSVVSKILRSRQVSPIL
jgi:hypothetical protein